jgi:Predicted hydrolases or acyltransferases (alpha/beta hydrolase superfamily)
MQNFSSSIAGVTVRWHDLPGQGDPVVFIHGLGCASSYEYPRVVADACFVGRRALLIDLPGSGFSDKPVDYSYSTSEQARVVAELLTFLKINRCYLYGHSMGGSIAIEVAGQLGSRVLALAVSEPNFYSGGGQFSRGIAAQAESTFIQEGYGQLVAAEKTAWAGSLQSTAPWALWRAASSLVAGVTPNWMSRYKALSCPRTLIFGADSLPDPDLNEIERAGLPIVIIPDVGHSMSWENPTLLAAALNAIFSPA